ncbi:MAG: tetratricopeptide repeat protein [Candidatus Aminicenantes bacterium]|nr:tetratricopeptide repeat protein [Candidatus Aminicenantes bacterium]
MSEREPVPVRDNVFISYSRKDEKWLHRVENMLQPLVSKGKIITWVDRKDIRPGDPWDEEIKKALAAAKIAVLLVSEQFLASEYITKIELPAILEATKKKECTIFWLRIDMCRYEETGLKDFQAAHKVSHPLEKLSEDELSDTLADISHQIYRVYMGKQIKILSITASSDDVDGAGDIFYEQEQDTLLNAFQHFDREDVYLDMPDPVKSTMDEIKERLADGKHDILHITAHGNINHNGEGFLCLEDHRGQLERVTGLQLAEVLQKLAPAPRIVILSSCHSARPEPGLMPAARALFEAGITTVIGMDKAVSHVAAIEFNAAFFTALCQKKTVTEAFALGKEAIFNGEQRRIKEIPHWNYIKEYEIPQLLTKDEHLTAASFSDYRIEAPGRPQSHHFQGAKYLERGFIGRRRVLREIFHTIANKEGAVVLKGPGGIGKSTLTTRIAANLLRKGYDFIIIRGDASEAKILEAIANKAAEKGVAGAKDVFAANAEPLQKLGWYVENYLGPEKVMVIFDNFEENQDEAQGDFGKGKETLKEFTWRFREYLKNKDSFLFFSTRYMLPGFEGPDLTRDIPEFSVVEFRKMLWHGKALQRLDGKSIDTLKQEIGGNPRALELLDRIAYIKFNKRNFNWEQLAALIPGLRKRIIEAKSAGDDFTPLFLGKLINYLSPVQRLIMEILSIYRNPVTEEDITIYGVRTFWEDYTRLADLSLLECIQEEKRILYYVHRLTAQYVLEAMEDGVRSKYHLQAGQYFKGIQDEEGNHNLYDGIESRWHYLQAGEWDQAAEITFALEDYLTLHGFPQWSMELLKELEDKELSDKNRAIVFLQMGILFQNFGDYDAALTQYQQSLEIDKKIGNMNGVSDCLHQIGRIYQEKGNYNAALMQYQQSLEIDEKIGNIKGISYNLHDIGNIYFFKGDYDAALTQYQQSLEIKEKIGDIQGLAISFHQIGLIYQEKGSYDEALTQYQKSLEIREKIGDIQGAAYSLGMIGQIFQNQGAYDNALENYQKVKNISEKIDDKKSVSIALHQIGRIYQDKGDYNAALTQYQQSFEINKKIGDIKGISANLHQIGMIYEDKGDYDAALTQYQQALGIAEKIGDVESKAINFHQSGIIYQNKGDYDAALTLYQQSFEIFEKIGNTFGMASSLGQMGKLYLEQNQCETALKLLVQSFAIFTKIGSPNANIVKRNIARCREMMTEEQFKDILNEIGMMNDE